MKKRYWLIRGYSSTKLIYERTLPIGAFSERQMGVLLQVLTAKAGLSNDEIVGAFSRRGSKLHNSHLALAKESGNYGLSCGGNPFFTAVVSDQGPKGPSEMQ